MSEKVNEDSSSIEVIESKESSESIYVISSESKSQEEYIVNSSNDSQEVQRNQREENSFEILESVSHPQGMSTPLTSEFLKHPSMNKHLKLRKTVNENDR